MADVGRFRIKQTPTDVWSIRERLALASSVSRSGDQNWVSVSRAVRPFGMPNRPSDWFSQKNCALQYSELLENVETPRRKRNEREAVETPGDVIVRKLTIERIEELKKLIAKEAEEYRSLKKDLENARAGLYDGQIKTMWEKLQEDKAAAVIAAEKAAAEEAAARERAKALKLKKPGLPILKSVPSSDVEDSTQDSTTFDLFTNEDSNISLISSVATPGPLQTTDTNIMNLASPAIGSFMPQSPKIETLPSVEESVQQDVISFMAPQTADLDEPNAVEKVEVKQEEIVAEEEMEKVEVEVASDVVVKTEEKEMLDEVSPDDVVDEAEVKVESPALEKEETILFEKDDATDDELIPFTPAEDNSPFVAPTETVITETMSDLKGPLEEEVDAEEAMKETVEEEVVEEIVPAETEEIHLPAAAEEEEVEQVEVETEERKEIEESQQDMEIKEEQVAVSAETEAPKSVEAPLPTAEVASPASSIVSTEAGSVQSKKSNKRGRGRKPKRVRRPPNRVRQLSEEGKESEVSSKEGETSDEEGSRSRIQPPDNDDSLLISSLPQHLDPNESLPNSPASLSHSDTEDEKSHRVWKKSIMLVWRAATNHKCASVFLHPVTEDIAPGYHSIVHKPMDLQKIKRKIDNGEIRTTAEFQRDMMLMFTNAIMYNNANHDVHKMAKNMYKDVMGHIEQFVSTQIMVQAEPKLLRTLRRTDACSSIHSDKEEDPKRKRAPDLEQTPATSGAKVKKRKL